MSNKSSKIVTTHSRQQTTRNIVTTRTVSTTQTTTSGFVSSNGSPVIADRAFSSVAPSTTKTYQPVYDQTRRLSENNSSIRKTPQYLLPTKSSSFSKGALSKAGGNLFYSFRNNDKNQSTSLWNNETAREAPSSSWKSPTGTSTSSSNRITQDARPYASTSTPMTLRSTTSSLEKYNLRNPAYVLIFHHLFKNNETLHRKGSEIDLKLIKGFFKGYNVKIADICEDFTVTKVKKKMNEVRLKNLGSYSCLIVIIMSHGGLNDQIQALDGLYQLDNAIVEPTLMNDTLKGKPKLFFVQACKGDAKMEADATPTATNKFDILKCFSTYEGTSSFRSTTFGTNYIQALFDLFKQNPDMEIIDIMRLMRSTFNNNKIGQAPTETSTLTKQFFFNDLKKP